MRRFKFQHQSILRLKRQEKREAMFALADTRKRLTECERGLEEAALKLTQETQRLLDLDNALPSTTPYGLAGKSMAIVSCEGLNAIRLEIEALERARVTLEQEHLARRDQLASRAREVKAFELLRDERLKEHRKAEEKRQQTTADEVAERRHRLRGMSTPDPLAALNLANTADGSES